MRRDPPFTLAISAGGWRDLNALAEWHYAAGPPATAEVFLRAHLRAGCLPEPTLAGILVVSRPGLAGWWRNRAWPGDYSARTPGGRTAALHRLNREVRTISRVIVDPRFRGLGIATALVRAYLADPATRRTEAPAAMGRLCPFFAAAGMREHHAGPDTPARELARTLRRLDVSRLDLLTGRRLRPAGDPLIALLRRWFRRQPFAHRLADLPDHDLAAAAARRIGPERGPARTAYTWPA
jgi:GNAT superfamily N-acetyltransferase